MLQHRDTSNNGDMKPRYRKRLSSDCTIERQTTAASEEQVIAFLSDHSLGITRTLAILVWNFDPQDLNYWWSKNCSRNACVDETWQRKRY